jgi:alginate O-acetyltransferase complex protein AlgJ
MQRVHRSADGWLFLVGGSNEVLRLYTDEGFAAAVDVPAWASLFAARDRFFRARGIRWRQLLAPEKLSVCGDDALRELAGTQAMPPAARLMQAAPHPALVCPAAYLRMQHGKGYEIYPRTDSHWTALGALCAFQWAMPALDVEIDFAEFLALPTQPLRYRGDLWSEDFAGLGEEDFLRRRMPDSIRRVHANPIVLLKESLGLENEMGLHVGSHVAYRNASAQRPERVVLFGSSFSEYRAECSLLTFLAALFFREVHFVWSSSLDLDFIAGLAPDLALLEMPERFVTQCPADRFDVAGHAARVVRDWTGRDASGR